MLSRAALALALAALTLAAPRAAQAVDATEAGIISAEIDDKQTQVAAKYGNRSYRDMSDDERKSFREDMNAAREEALKSHGTNAHDWEAAKLRLDRESAKSFESGKNAYAAKKKADEEAAKAAKQEPAEVKVQRGFSDKSPVDLTGDGNLPASDDANFGKSVDAPKPGKGGGSSSRGRKR